MDTGQDIANARRILEEFVREHQGYLRSIAWRMAPHPGMADDIAQDALLIAVKRAGAFDQTKDIRAWLAGIVRNLCHKAWERVKKEDRMKKDTLAEYLDEVAGTPSVSWEADAADRLRDCLQKLPDRSRETIRLRYQEMLRSDVIAERMGTRAGAVRQALSRILAELRKCVSREDAQTGVAV